MASPTIYLDYQATTPMAPEVFAAMRPWLERDFANPHSAHVMGRKAAAAVEVARSEVGRLMPGHGRLVFTSGATEAINLAIKGSLPLIAPAHKNRLVAPATEHAAVRDCMIRLVEQGYAIDWLPVDSDGLVIMAEAERIIGPDTAMVAAMQVNNEIGVIQPVDDLAAMARRYDAPMLCDAVQAFGRMDMVDSPDMIAISGHKIHGPKGIGALWVHDGHKLTAMIDGGGQELGLRSGTLSPALCVGLGKAASIAQAQMRADQAHVAALWDHALTYLDGWTINGSQSARYKGNLNVRREGLDVARLMSDCREVAFSAGSACASGSGRPSHVLSALGLSRNAIISSIRLGFGRYSDSQELGLALETINRAVRDQGI